MRLVGITQRALPPTEFGESRDALDVRWPVFLAACGLTGIPLPNVADIALKTANCFTRGGIILTGGGDLAAYGGNSPHRDETEARLLRWALTHDVPVLGVCRGMQMILHAFGSVLSPVNRHAGTRHRVEGESLSRTVNSYHRWAATDVKAPLSVLARHGHVIEAIQHREAPLTGVMWHPERESAPNPQDVTMFRELFLGSS